MQLNPATTVREFVTENPSATRVFEELKIDYCCGGNKPLSDACAAAGISMEEVMQKLEAATNHESAAIDLQSATLTEITNHILDTHHVYTKTEMNRLRSLFAKVCEAHGGNHPELSEVRETFSQICADLEPHMFKEEQILFPYILQLDRAVANGRAPMFPPFGTVQNPVRMMSFEHDLVGDLLKKMRALSGDYAVPADACPSYTELYRSLEAFESDLHQHIHLENNFQFPKAIELETKAFG